MLEIEIFQKVHKIATRIKAAKAQNLLENDFEYISLVYQLLPESQRERWVNYASSNPTWNSFYKFLEDVYEKALLKKQINDSCKQTLGKDKVTCTICNRIGHSADKCYKKNVFATTVGPTTCPVCDGPLHSFKSKEGDNFYSKRVYSCPKFRAADDNTQKQFFSSAKSKVQKICKICTGWSHDTSTCKYKDVRCKNAVVIILMRLVHYNKFKSLDNLKDGNFYLYYIYYKNFIYLCALGIWQRGKQSVADLPLMK